MILDLDNAIERRNAVSRQIFKKDLRTVKDFAELQTLQAVRDVLTKEINKLRAESAAFEKAFEILEQQLTSNKEK